MSFFQICKHKQAKEVKSSTCALSTSSETNNKGEANPNKDKRCLKIASISENLLNNQEMNKFTADKSASEITYSWTQKCIKAKD